LAVLLRYERIDGWVLVWTLLAGSAVSLFGPAMLALVAAGVERRFGLAGPNWTAWFAISCFALLPILFWFEHRTLGRYYEEAVIGSPTPQSASSYGEWRILQAEAQGRVFVELMLYGPRQVMQAWRGWDERKALAIVDRARAAEMLDRLLVAEGGVQTSAVALPDEPPEALALVLRYLIMHDWIGLSKDGVRVWMLSDARKRFGPQEALTRGPSR
jgi:hypothetical protein